MNDTLSWKPVYRKPEVPTAIQTSIARKNSVDTAVTLPQYLVLIGEPIPSVGLHRTRATAPNRRHLAREKVHGGKHFMATKKKAAKKKKKH
jgi:hypothetical protein